MFYKCTPEDRNVGSVTRVASYLSKEDNISLDQIKAIENGIDRTVNYCEKENGINYQLHYLEGLGLDKQELEKCLNFLAERSVEDENFFHDKSKNIESSEIVEKISANYKGFKKKDARFYMLAFNPSKTELDHLAKLADAQIQNGMPFSKDELMRDYLKEYARDVMDNYAKNFGREGLDGGADLVWYGKVERDRYWKYDDKEVINNKTISKEIKQLSKTAGNESKINKLKLQYARDTDGRIIYCDMPKAGLNYHVHIVVSRKDKEQKYSLSPLAKQINSENHRVNGHQCKVGFNRNAFVQSMEKSFDNKFGYIRQFSQSYEGRKLLVKMQKLSKESSQYRQSMQNYKDAKAQYNRDHGIKEESRRLNNRYRMVVKNSAKNLCQSNINRISKELIPREFQVAFSSVRSVAMFAKQCSNQSQRLKANSRNFRYSIVRSTGKVVKPLKVMKNAAMMKAPAKVLPVSLQVALKVFDKIRQVVGMENSMQ